MSTSSSLNGAAMSTATTDEADDDTTTTMAHAVPLDDTNITISAANIKLKPHSIRVSSSFSMMDADCDGPMPPPPASTTSTTSEFSPAGGMATATADGDEELDNVNSNNNNHNVDDDDDDSTNRCAISCAGEEQEEEESDYEYDYDDDDDGHFQGFLEPAEASAVLAPYQQGDNHNNPNVIENTDATTSAADSAAAAQKNDSAGSSSKNNNAEKNTMILGSLADHLPPASGSARASATSSAPAESSPQRKKSTWKEPSQAAVSMSLRAEREKSGGKRRLASDLYKIMMGDTTEQGFKMEPTSEDSMDLWTIKLFGFDKDSNLSKDMDLLGLENVELEMSFPDDVSSSNMSLVTYFLLSCSVVSDLICLHLFSFSVTVPPIVSFCSPICPRGPASLQAPDGLCHEWCALHGTTDNRWMESSK
jgi:hypothetical protein